MHEPSVPLSRFWAYAASYGALWGAVEVTVGSFLHALRIPFAGVLLASIGAALLVAERQACNRRGLTLATGLVAALCKSLSPAGIIWNPMVGIVMEALLVEASLLLTARSRATAAVAGALAVSWAVAQGLLMQWVVYGSTVVTLYVTVVGKTAAWLGFAPRSGFLALGAVLALFVGTGTIGGVWGRRIGQMASDRPVTGEMTVPQGEGTGPTTGGPSSLGADGSIPGRAPALQERRPLAGGTPVSSGTRGAILLAVGVTCVAMQYPAHPMWSALALAMWLASAALFDRASLARMWQPRFLAVSMVLAGLSGLLLGTADTEVAGVRVSSAGLGAGAVMVLRGLLIVGIGAWGARWLLARASRLQAGHAARLSNAAAAAFDMVPELRTRIRAANAGRASSGGHAWSGLERAAVTLLAQAAGLAEGLSRQGRVAADGRADG